jgi:hypothetical protein
VTCTIRISRLDGRVKLLYKSIVIPGGAMSKPVVSCQTARILAMLLRCGMICTEELEVVLDMIEVPGACKRHPVAGSRG